jgi:diaminohydroxyphosphoribosylaminopyrimidine deaminase/5-amino-6-(5-phosphoribosylamino)uracil reductase
MLNLGPFTQLEDAIHLSFQSVERVGPDLRVIARPPERDRF